MAPKRKQGKKGKKGKCVQVVREAGDEESTMVAAMAKMELTKTAHEKVENAGLPHGHGGPAFVIKPVDPSSQMSEYHENSLIMTTIPPRGADHEPSREKYPNGFTECYIYGPTKRTILDTRGFPQGLKQTLIPACTIRPTPIMGLGTFATRAIDTGELILSERPLTVSPHLMPSPVSKEQLIKVGLRQMEEPLQALVGRMIPSDREAFLLLANSHKDDGSGPLLGIIRTNSFGVPIPNGSEGTSSGHVYGAVFDKLSRVNHSCRPNVATYFDIPSFSMQLYAVRPIAEDEELFVTYADVLAPAEERQKSLIPYGFQCLCPSCTGPAVLDSDRIRMTLQIRASQFIVKGGALLKALCQGETPDDAAVSARDALEVAKKLCEDIEGEGLHGREEYSDVSGLVFCLMDKLGDGEQAMEYAVRSAKLLHAAYGQNVPEGLRM